MSLLERFLFTGLWLCLVLIPSIGIAQTDHLKVLDVYAGTWDSEFSIEGPDGQITQKFSGWVSAKWVVGGRFLDQTGTYKIDNSDSEITIKTMMSYDQKNGRYHFVYFTSTGDIRHSNGKWDETTRMMTSEMKDADSGNVSTIIADFSKPGVEHWVIETKDADGKTLTRLSGTNTRRASKAP